MIAGLLGWLRDTRDNEQIYILNQPLPGCDRRKAPLLKFDASTLSGLETNTAFLFVYGLEYRYVVACVI
jgi:hypothetical protein